jgi:hypothetical protein
MFYNIPKTVNILKVISWNNSKANKDILYNARNHFTGTIIKQVIK